MINWTLEEIEQNGYNVADFVEESETCAFWKLNDYAREHDIRLEDVMGFRLAENHWIIVQKLKAKSGYISQPLLP